MRLLLISPNVSGHYTGSLLRSVTRALDHAGIGWDVIGPIDLIGAGYDLYVGVGDELLRKRRDIVRRIRDIGGTSADFRSRFLPRKPKAWLQDALRDRADYVLTHFRAGSYWHPRALYVGQGVNDDLLYPEHDPVFTIFVDHRMDSRRSHVQAILDQCAELAQRRRVRIWHHTSEGIVENQFVEDHGPVKSLPFAEIAAYYRRTHVFLPTHRETQGMVGAEIGVCGGLVLLRPLTYPPERFVQIPHRFYWSRISWPDFVDVNANRAKTMMHFGVDAFAARLECAVSTIVSARRRAGRL